MANGFPHNADNYCIQKFDQNVRYRASRVETGVGQLIGWAGMLLVLDQTTNLVIRGY
jgi:hypothetical protein